LLFGGERLSLGPRGSFFGLGALAVGLELADLGEIAGFVSLPTARRDAGLLAALRRERDAHPGNDYHNNDDDNDSRVHVEGVPASAYPETQNIGATRSCRPPSPPFDRFPDG